MKHKLLAIIAILSYFLSNAQNIPELDEIVKTGKLPNGLTYYIRKNTEPKDRAELYLVNKFGSLQETDDQQGLAHFTEHMAFNGTRDFPKNTLIDYLQKAGVRFGADLNAYTSFDQTVYQLPIPTNDPELFDKGFDILLNWAGFIMNEGKEIDAERGIILEEDRARGKDMGERISKQTMPLMLMDSRYVNRIPIGKTEILKTFKHKTLVEYYKAWYRPNLQAIIAVGDFDPEVVERLIIEKFSILKNPKKSKPLERYFVPNNDKPVVKVVTDPELPYTVFQLYYKDGKEVIKTEAQYKNFLINNLINIMLSERLEAIRQQPDAPYLGASAGYGDFIGNRNAFALTVQSADAKGIERAVRSSYTEVLRMKTYGFTEGELARAKKSLLASMELSYSERTKLKSIYFINQYQQHFLTGEVSPGIEFEYQLYQKLMPAIILGEINKVAANHIKKDNQVVILQANEKDKAALPNEQTLLSWLAISTQDIEPYSESVVGESFMLEKPEPGSTVSEKRLPAIDATELTLSNGVKVIVKQTDFKTNEIQITTFSKGGTSLADRQLFRTAQYSTSIIGASGIASFSSTEMDKMLAGKNLYVSPYIGTYEEGMQAFSTPDDLETTFQLIHLYFTAPRKDTVALNILKKQLLTGISTRYENPVAAFQDTLLSVLSGHNYRTKVITSEEVKGIRSDEAIRFYRDRFSDADDFTFVIIGNVNRKVLLPLLNTYVASLPSKPTSDKIFDLGLLPLKGKVSRTVYRGLEDKATVMIVYHGLYDYSPEQNMLLNGLQAILKNTLTERLRERESGVYSPSVGISKDKTPVANYKLQISFNCAPANTERLVKAVQEEIERIKKHGVSEENLVKFKAEIKRQFELQIRENGFWLSYIKSVYKGESTETAYQTFLARTDEVTSEQLRQAALRYLNTNNVATLLLLPENAKKINFCACPGNHRK